MKLTLIQTFMSHILILLKRKVLVNILQGEEKHLQKNTVRILHLCLLYYCVVSWQLWIKL